MSKHIVGLVDYGAGNFTSVRHAINNLGFRSRIVNKYEDFKGVSSLLLPGVGAFASAMNALNEMELTEPIREFAHQGRPVIGVCLGMQLLADASYEHGYTRGLELIPGEVHSLEDPGWHIGWNTLEIVSQEKIVADSHGRYFYYNHSFEFKAPDEYVVGVSRVSRAIVAVVKKQNICGFQFHPERSQIDGISLMGSALKEMVNA